MERMIMALMLPLIALSWLAGPVGGVWLAVRGDWGSIGYAAISLVAGHFVIGLALLPAVALAAPAAHVGERKPRLGVALGLPSLIYVAALGPV